MKKIGFTLMTALVFTLGISCNFSGPTLFLNIVGIAVAHAAGPDNGTNNPAKCKSATNPKCNVNSPS
jgi:hypothetical protein